MKTQIRWSIKTKYLPQKKKTKNGVGKCSPPPWFTRTVDESNGGLELDGAMISWKCKNVYI
jgi:hypothetical protein